MNFFKNVATLKIIVAIDTIRATQLSISALSSGFISLLLLPFVLPFRDCLHYWSDL